MREMKENKKVENRLVLSEDVNVRNSQIAEFTKKFCEEHKELIDRLGE